MLCNSVVYTHKGTKSAWVIGICMSTLGPQAVKHPDRWAFSPHLLPASSQISDASSHISSSGKSLQIATSKPHPFFCLSVTP